MYHTRVYVPAYSQKEMIGQAVNHGSHTTEGWRSNSKGCSRTSPSPHSPSSHQPTTHSDQIRRIGAIRKSEVCWFRTVVLVSQDRTDMYSSLVSRLIPIRTKYLAQVLFQVSRVVWAGSSSIPLMSTWEMPPSTHQVLSSHLNLVESRIFVWDGQVTLYRHQGQWPLLWAVTSWRHCCQDPNVTNLAHSVTLWSHNDHIRHFKCD